MKKTLLIYALIIPLVLILLDQWTKFAVIQSFGVPMNICEINRNRLPLGLQHSRQRDNLRRDWIAIGQFLRKAKRRRYGVGGITIPHLLLLAVIPHLHVVACGMTGE